MKHLSIKKQYLLKFALVTLIPLLVIAVIFYIIHLRTVEDDVIELEYYRLEQAQQILDAQIREMYEISVMVKTDQRLFPANLRNDIFMQASVKDILLKHNATNKLAENIQLYYRDFDGVYSHEGFTSFDIYLKMRYDISDTEREKLKQFIVSCTSPGFHPLTVERQKYLVFFYPVQYHRNTSYITLFYLIPESNLKNSLSRYRQGENDIYTMILDKDGEIVYSDVAPEKVFSENMISAHSRRNLYEGEISGEEYTFMSVVSDYNGWRYVLTLPTNALLSGVRQQRLLIVQIVPSKSMQIRNFLLFCIKHLI